MPVPLMDPFARRVKDLRVSITDRCNFRCAYCMPEEGMEWLAREELLTYEEMASVARVCVERYGFEAIRLTGGEPLVRAHVTRLVQLLAPLGVDIALTTNGVRSREGRRRTFHRVHAARRARGVESRQGRARARDRRTHQRRVPLAAGQSRSRRTRGALCVPRRHRRHRCDRECERTVLRQLRP